MAWHIVHVLSSMGIGGQERVALDLTKGFLLRGHRVSAVSFLSGGQLSEEFRSLGAPVVELQKREGVDGRLFVDLTLALRRLRADVVHTHNPQPLLYTAPAAKLLGIRAMVHTKHGANPDTKRRVFLRQLTARLCGAYVAVSAETASVAERMDRVRAPRLQVVRNGIDLDRFQPDPEMRARVRDELQIPPDAWVVGNVGRMVGEKAQADLIAAVARLCEGTSGAAGARPIRLLIIGDGWERQRLAQAAAPLGKTVLFPGTRKDVPRLLQAMDVFCLSSITEGLPLVIPEAMATGLPVVATAVGGVPSVVIDGETGFLVPPGQPQALADSLRRLYDDPAGARSLGQRGRALALLRYSLSRMIDEYEGIYKRLLSADCSRS